MTWPTWLDPSNVWSAAAGLAGAAAMAATDWRGPSRFAQHLVVGFLSSQFATVPLWNLLSEMVGFAENSDPGATYFLVGAFAIYILEFGKAAIAAFRKIGKDD